MKIARREASRFESGEGHHRQNQGWMLAYSRASTLPPLSCAGTGETDRECPRAWGLISLRRPI
jgi:hypothetical protein